MADPRSGQRFALAIATILFVPLTLTTPIFAEDHPTRPVRTD
jgi:hypothetical protein